MKKNIINLFACTLMLLFATSMYAQGDRQRRHGNGEHPRGPRGEMRGQRGEMRGERGNMPARPFVMADASELNAEGRDTAYVRTIMERAAKNISALNLPEEKFTPVRNIVANRYFELNDIYTERDNIITFAKDSLQGKAKQWAIDNARAVADSKCYRSHFALAAKLSLYLTEDEITMVKDGITFNKVKVTYEAYLDEIPSLKEEEKAQIYAWMIEARELALDAESSKMKHDVFNKYKGRVNNYLSKRGYDLNKEREAWFKRIEERKKQQQ